MSTEKKASTQVGFPSVGFPSVGVLWGGDTREEIQEFLDWCVDHGARAWESVLYDERYDRNLVSDYDCFGVDNAGETRISNLKSYYTATVNTIEEAKEIIIKELGLEEPQKSFQAIDAKVFVNGEEVLCMKQQKPIKSNGGSSAYYRFSITSSITGETMEVETGDVIRHMVGNDFDLGNIIKACRRIHQAKQGKGKEGTDVEYDANKIAYFAEQLKKEG